MNSFETAINSIIEQSGFGGAIRHKLMEDASTRSYERLTLGDKTAILMKAPPGNENPPCPLNANEADRVKLGWNALSRLAASRVEAFVAIANFLRANGFTTPEIYACDVKNGLAVIEDLGDNLFANILKNDDSAEIELYETAGALLAKLHNIEIPKIIAAPNGAWPLLDFDRLALYVNADLFVEWVPKLLNLPEYDDDIMGQWDKIRIDIIEKVLKHPRAFTLRDYHAENNLWLDGREGIAKIGLLDFQDAVIGFRAWDFSMLLHDARRDVSKAAYEATIKSYIKAADANEAALRREIDLEGAINCLRIIGIFSRLIARDKKDRYREFMPRMINHLESILENPELSELKAWIENYAPLKELKRI